MLGVKLTEAPGLAEVGEPGVVDARSSLTVPLRIHGKVIGVLNVESQRPKAFGNEERQLGEIFAHHAPQVVFHAAAYKHVPLMENGNALQAVINNARSTIVTARAAQATGTRTYVLVSTDKAVNPTSVMGASKRLAEMLCQSLQPCGTTQFVIPTFTPAATGNVNWRFEIFDEPTFKSICPGKAREYGLARYLKAVEYCATLAGKGDPYEPWVSNGEIIAGLEPPEWSIKAIEHITSVGAIPTVCVFRPLKGTDYAHVAPPRTEDLVPVFRHAFVNGLGPKMQAAKWQDVFPTVTTGYAYPWEDLKVKD